MAINNGEIVFIKSVKDGIPNRDPLNDSDARRIFPEEDGRISLSDVSIKRDVRDYVLDLFRMEEKNKNYILFKKRWMEKKVIREKKFGRMDRKEVGKEKEAKEDMKSVLLEHSFDVRHSGLYIL